MESLRSERRTTARHKREPLANLTNARPLSSSAARSLLKPKPTPKPKASDPPKSSLSSNLDAVPVKSSSSIGSSDPDNPRDGRISTSGLPTTEISTKIDGATSYRESKHSMNHARQSVDKRKDKGKAVSFSCPPVERTRSIGGKLKMGKEGDVLPGTFSVPRQKTKKRQRYTTSDDAILHEPVLSPKFIEDQRAYFAEIDAFDLAEEVVSESELE